MHLGQLARLLPFLKWFEGYNSGRFRLDLVGGLTVALVLVPQSMAYAQLAGLPPYYGLYAAFLPPMIAALFGSSRQLATGPVAIVSLMTATALEPLATAGGEQYIAYAILLALLIGTFQFLLGVLRLGLVVNFLSHPVVGGFTNAAAIIIATSQLSKIFGVAAESGTHHYETVYNVVKAAIASTHWPTLAFAALAFAIMILLRRINRRWPNVLVAVILTTMLSWFLHYDHNVTARLDEIEDPAAVSMIADFNAIQAALADKAAERVQIRERYDAAVESAGAHSPGAIGLSHNLALVTLDLERLKSDLSDLKRQLRMLRFGLIELPDGRRAFLSSDEIRKKDVKAGLFAYLKVGNNKLDSERLVLKAGGDVVGEIPRGLPAISLPVLNGSIALHLLPMAMIISLLGFMEAISIAKAMAAKTGQRIDPNQELVGQGLANILGSATQSYAVSGSFSRSAVNLLGGAVSGMSYVICWAVVVVVLLFLTPLLYHLPQAVLAAVIMMAVVGLINVHTFVHAWRAQRYDGIIGVITFVATLVFAPHLDRGILIGVILSLLLYMVRNMKPAIAKLALHWDGTYRNRERFDLGQCRHILVLRYAGSLFFANVSYLEEQFIETCRTMPELRHVILVGNGINELDASGVDTLEIILERLDSRKLKFSVTGLNDHVIDTLRRTGLLARIGEENVFRNASRAIDSVWDRAHENSTEHPCPLRVAPPLMVLPTDAGARKWPPSPPDKKK